MSGRPPDPASGDVALQWGVRIPMRDGVDLGATLYRPAEEAAARPVLFTLTPYVGQAFHDVARNFAAQGYPFLTIDVRGRGNSDGQFAPIANEDEDCFDIISWIAAQPWCNGKVAMWGGSYGGYVQWAAIRHAPPALATIVPVAAPFRGGDSPMRNNIFTPYTMRWLMLVAGRAGQEAIFKDWPFWSRLFRRWFEAGAAFADLDAMVGYPSPDFQRWITHPMRDAFWDSYNPTPAQYARCTLPVLTITGIYDTDQQGALLHYRTHLDHAGDAACHYLVIGPWDHAGTRTPQPAFGGLRFGPDSLVDLQGLHLDWYRWTMEGGPRPDFLARKVAYYVTGAERWRHADTLDAVTARHQPLYLDAAANPDELFHAGDLCDAPPTAAACDHYVYDPHDVSHAALESEIDPESLTDQSLLLRCPGRSLVYHSAPLPADTEISGVFRLEAWISIDQPDTDFRAAVYEIDDQGRSILLAHDTLRARYREGLRTARLVNGPEPLRYLFETFNFTSRMVRKGHRLRLVVGPTNSIYLQRNFNAGGDVARETIADARAVTVRLWRGPDHPSALHVPLAPAED